jgi:hypothetical protein
MRAFAETTISTGFLPRCLAPVVPNPHIGAAQFKTEVPEVCLGMVQVEIG